MTEEEPPARRRRFSSDSINDLLFWGVHLMVVAIALGIIWVKVDNTTKVLEKLLHAQSKEVDLIQAKAMKAEEAEVNAHNAERQRSIEFHAAAGVLNSVLEQVREIQDDIKATLAKATEINERVLQASQNTELAAQKAAGSASQAAANATQAATNAGAAAAASGHTATVVRSRVVTTQDKLQLQAQERKLAQKQQQLTKTIQKVKKTGPTLWQKLTH